MFEPVQLSDGTQIRVSAAYPFVTIEHRAERLVLAKLQLPFPSAGLGGGALVLSPSERLALVTMYSGQSEEGYQLLQIQEGLRLIASEPYRFGESASYCFAPDESVLAMALPFSCTDWWLPWDDGELERDDQGQRTFSFGELQFRDLKTQVSIASLIKVRPPQDWEPSRAQYDPDLRPRFADPEHLRFQMPWGEVEVRYPPAEDIVLTPT
jgi:hypothetical protein